MKKNILILDDSALMRRALSAIINKTEEYQVAWEASNGLEGLSIVETEHVDMILLDMHMPKMNGVEFLRVLKENDVDIPVVVISGYSKRDTKDTIEALELGALEFVRKPESVLKEREEFETHILRVLKYSLEDKKLVNSVPRDARTRPVTQKTKTGHGRLVAIACSTGGPKALQDIIPLLPADLAAPVIIVQHMPAGFTNSLAVRLNHLSKVEVSEAEDNQVLENGHVYIARGGKHLLVKARGTGHVVSFSEMPPVNGLRPCANYMYESLENSNYEKIICVVLTGMGADGTQGIQRLNNSKLIHVIAQDAATSTIYGMPRAVTEAGMVDEIRPLTEIAEAIKIQVGVR
ncbi:MAG: chemotaxis-specific protein-glutamate methyltransferase CheB [Lachnospiraceae bacterium]|nr:chemotaxis-specific protein-glutamate methyltransferase CheB [Lachnospiraceae bacterium]